MEGLPDCGSIMDTFGIDDLLDFSNDDIAGAIGDLGDDTMQQQQQLSADSSLTTAETVSCNFSATGNNNNNKSRASSSPAATGAAAAVATGISSLIEKDFCVPYEDMVELEWLSNFVEDSFSAGNASHSNNSRDAAAFLGFSTVEEQQQQHSSGQPQQQQQRQEHQLSSTNNNNNSKQHHFHMLSPVSVLESSATSERATGEAEVVLPGRKRGRPRAASRIVGSSSSASSSYEEEEETSDAHESDCALSTESEVMTEEHELEWPPRKPPPHPSKRQCLKESSDGSGGGSASAAAGRRCSHCLTQRTPQWRAGPLGPKTLCNACGVRFKSGRLLPEYRPAGSPTFVADKHSNSHRKVLEMRKQREEVASTVKRLQEAEGELEEEEVILLS